METWQTVWDAVQAQFSDLPDLRTGVRVGVRLVLAAILGGFLGWDRERLGKAAGLRTHMLVAVGSALFVVVTQEFGMSGADLSRVVQGLVTGLGFIGGGVILKLEDEQRVRGLTTAAGIWLTAGLGVAAGLGHGATAVLATFLAFVIVALLRPLERWLDR
jgi:putative Mg2+ transporter-C (MgtC) family protein